MTKQIKNVIIEWEREKIKAFLGGGGGGVGVL